MDTERLDRAAEAVADGDLVIYPTETVYGLGANALDGEAVDHVFAAKGRARSEPISMAVASVDAALEYVDPTPEEESFMREFLPGPVTVVCGRREMVPDELTGGRERVGIRVPDHEVALSLVERTGPLTATSANVTGQPSARTVDEIDPGLRDRVAMILDDGETPGGESTVVDVGAGDVLREGDQVEEIRDWLDQHGGD